MAKVVLSLSGGMDSATLLMKAINDGHEVFPVGFQYRSKHNGFEQQAAYTFLRHLAKERIGDSPINSGPDAEDPPSIFHRAKQIDVTEVFQPFKSNLLQGQGAIPEGHYEAESMKQTVVPGRNMIFASILAGYAESIGADEVWLGVHSGDHVIYPDCREQFIDSMGEAIFAATDGKVQLFAPFLNHTKADILREGLLFGVPYQYTRTCYVDNPIACGKCGSCQERLEAFKIVGVEDPIEYESRVILPK